MGALLHTQVGLCAVGKPPVGIQLRIVVDAHTGLLHSAPQGDDELGRRLSHIAVVEVAWGRLSLSSTCLMTPGIFPSASTLSAVSWAVAAGCMHSSIHTASKAFRRVLFEPFGIGREWCLE